MKVFQLKGQLIKKINKEAFQCILENNFINSSMSQESEVELGATR